MRRTLLTWILSVGFGLSISLGWAADCETLILPEPAHDEAGYGHESCTYTYLPYAALEYDAGKLKASWDARYRVREMYLFDGVEVISGYAPGTSLPLTRDVTKDYSFVGRVTDTTTDENLLVITPAWCASDTGLIDAPSHGCQALDPASGSCSVTSTATCADGKPRTVTCSGDVANCNDYCASETQACCTSKVRAVSVPASGVVRIKEEVVRTEHACPASDDGALR